MSPLSWKLHHQGGEAQKDVTGFAAGVGTPEADPRGHHTGAGSWETEPVRLPVESERGPPGGAESGVLWGQASTLRGSGGSREVLL